MKKITTIKEFVLSHPGMSEEELAELLVRERPDLLEAALEAENRENAENHRLWQAEKLLGAAGYKPEGD